jgi:hypothetical protein
LKRKILVATLVVVAAAQIIPVERTNPPVELEVPAPDEVREVLRRACYDCHSNESRWPWYAYVAPSSWLVAHDVAEARDHVNFSTWNEYDEDERLDHREDAWEEVEDGEMPLWFYVAMHPQAHLGAHDLEILRAWAKGDD